MRWMTSSLAFFAYLCVLYGFVLVYNNIKDFSVSLCHPMSTLPNAFKSTQNLKIVPNYTKNLIIESLYSNYIELHFVLKVIAMK